MSVGNVRIADDVVFEILEDETVVLNLTSGEYYSLNQAGTRVWQLIEEHGDLDAIREAMVAEFDVSPERLSGDLDRLMRDLTERRLVVVS